MYSRLIILLFFWSSCVANAQNKQPSSIPLNKNDQEKGFKHSEKQAIAATDQLAKQYLEKEIKEKNNPISDVQIKEMIASFFNNAEKKTKKYKNENQVPIWLVSYWVTASRLEITVADKTLQLINIRDVPMKE